MTAYCCKPGAREGTGWRDRDPLAREGWNVYDIHTSDCMVVSGLGMHQYCTGANDCGGFPEIPDCGACGWHLGDPMPEGEEFPCGIDGPGWDAECECCIEGSPILISLKGSFKLRAPILIE